MEKYVAEVFKVLHGELSDLKRVTKFVSPKLTIKLSRRRFKNGKTDRTYLLTVGRPNYDEKKFIQACLKAGEKFPVRKPRLQFYPKKKK